MLRFTSLFVFTAVLTGCSEFLSRTEINPPMTSEDMKTLTSRPESMGDILPYQKTVSAPLKPIYPSNFYKKVSINVTEHVPLKQILMEIAKQVKIDLQLDKDIDSHVVFQASNRSFIEIIEDLCEITDLRFRVKNQAIRIERDTPYSENYNIQFLNVSRNSQNRISVATDVFAQNGVTNPSSSNNDNGSNSSVTVETKNDFWAELEDNIKILLFQEHKQHKTKNKIESSTYSVHKQGGLITIYAPEKAHKRIQSYLAKLKFSVSRQVLIEAKIIEVTLKDEYRAGIDWQKLNGGDLRLESLFGSAAAKSTFLNPADAQQSMLSFGAQSTSFKVILNALQQFGHSRTISSPRLTVMNNQSAILKVAQNQVYFKMNYDKQYSQNVDRSSVSISSDIQTVPIGLMMSVQPSIDPETGEIILFLRPTISRMNKSVADPAVDIAYNANLSSSGSNSKLTPSMIPVVEVREIDSVLRLKNGEIGIMGGLMEVRSYKDTNKIPGLGDLLKDVFSSAAEGEQVVELVIALKATIPMDAPSPDAADTRISNQYIADPRKWEKK